MGPPANGITAKLQPAPATTSGSGNRVYTKVSLVVEFQVLWANTLEICALDTQIPRLPIEVYHYAYKVSSTLLKKPLFVI